MSPSATSFDPPFPDAGTPARSRQSANRLSFRRADPFANRPLRRVPGVGPQPCSLMLIGEKPGAAESRRGLPFIGPAGQYLDLCLAAANIERKDIYITNLTKEFTDYSRPSRAEIDRDHEELVGEILCCNPEVIGLVGAFAVENLLGVEHAEMEKCHGIPRHVDALFGGELPRDGGWTVIPLLHPAGATHAPDSLPLILDDVLQLGRLLDHEISVREDDPYAGLEDYRDYPVSERGVVVHKPCGVDTEGSREHPWCMTVSTRPGTGMLFKPGQQVKFKGKVYLWNALHDLGVLRALGVELADDQYVDLMIYSYLLCVAPKGLKPSAYRECGMHQDDYDDIVRDARLEKAMQYLFTAADREWPKAEPQVIQDGSSYRVYKPRSVNFRINKILDDWTKWQIGDREEEVDLRKRWRDIEDEIKAPVIAAMGDMPDANLDDVPYERAQFYAIRDADATLRMAPILEQKIKDMGLEEIAVIDHAILPMLDDMQRNGIKLAPPSFWTGIEAQCEAQMAKAQYEIFKLTGEDINPASGDQVAALLYGKLKLMPPKYTDSGERGSVNALCLESLLGDNPVVQHIMDFTEAKKLVGTYVEPLRNLCTVGNGRVHSTIRSTRTTTGRLAMADPPLHQIPIMSDIGKQLRGGFIAEEGRILYDIDVDQLEARIGAHDSRDEELCRLFNEGRDIHSETACSIFSVPMSALSIGPTGKVNDYRRTVAKHCIAEGELVLTDQGLIPIQKITLQHKLWDGVEWVSHDGLIDQGIREVITYEGLTATPDHEVYIGESTTTLRQASLGLVRMVTTGNGGQEIRSAEGHFSKGSAQERIRGNTRKVHTLWQEVLVRGNQSTQGENRMQSVLYAHNSGEVDRLSPIWKGSSPMGRLRATGNEGEKVRFRRRNFIKGSAYERIYRTESEVYEMWSSLVDHQVKSNQTGLSRLQNMQHDQVQISRHIRGQIRRYLPTLQYSSLSELQGLWGTRYKVPVQVERTICKVGGEEFASSELQRNHDREDRQRWQLRTRKFEVGNLQRAELEQAQYGLDEFPRRAGFSGHFRQPIRKRMDPALSSSRYDRRADHRECYRAYSERPSVQDMASDNRVVKVARVYDVVNAGPRRRFTVSGKLVSNCMFGILNGLTEHGMINYLIINRCRRPDGESWTLDDCVMLIAEWFKKYKGVKRFQEECMEETRQTGLARETIGGRIIYLPQIWSPVKKVRDTAERMSYVMHTQSGGQSLIKRCMAVIWKEVCKREDLHIKSLLQMHDELLFEIPDDERIKREVDRECTRIFCNTVKLRIPVKASGGCGPNWLVAH